MRSLRPIFLLGNGSCPRATESGLALSAPSTIAAGRISSWRGQSSPLVHRVRLNEHSRPAAQWHLESGVAVSSRHQLINACAAYFIRLDRTQATDSEFLYSFGRPWIEHELEVGARAERLGNQNVRVFDVLKHRAGQRTGGRSLGE